MMSAPQQLFIVKAGCTCVCAYLDVLLDLVSALLMTSEGADCRLWAKVFIFCREREEMGQCKRWPEVMVCTVLFLLASHDE